MDHPSPPSPFPSLLSTLPVRHDELLYFWRIFQKLDTESPSSPHPGLRLPPPPPPPPPARLFPTLLSLPP